MMVPKEVNTLNPDYLFTYQTGKVILESSAARIKIGPLHKKSIIQHGTIKYVGLQTHKLQASGTEAIN
jgi:hypothetical protein